MNTCKYLKSTCKKVCNVNENGTHIVSGNGRVGIYKLDKDNIPAYFKKVCPRYAYLKYSENFLNDVKEKIKKHQFDVVGISMDESFELLDKACIFGPLENKVRKSKNK